MEEVVAEKLRAISFIQNYPRNRDLFDIWYINKYKKLDKKKTAGLFVKKCIFKGIEPALIKKVNGKYLTRFAKSWQVQLEHQIKTLPSFDLIKRELIPLINELQLIIDKCVYSGDVRDVWEAKKMKTQQESKGQVILYKNRVEVRFEKDTVWLTQKQMAELFNKGIPNFAFGRLTYLRNILLTGILSMKNG